MEHSIDLNRFETSSRSSSKVITNSGIGNQKNREKAGSYQPQIGVSFVVVGGTDYYVRPLEYGIGMEDSRRNHKQQIEAALSIYDIEYFEFMDEFDFRESMVDWSMMEHAKVDKPKRLSGMTPTMGQSYGTNAITPHTNPLKDKDDNSKIGRNDACICGSGKKFKKCCIGEY